MGKVGVCRPPASRGVCNHHHPLSEALVRPYFLGKLGLGRTVPLDSCHFWWDHSRSFCCYIIVLGRIKLYGYCRDLRGKNPPFRTIFLGAYFVEVVRISGF